MKNIKFRIILVFCAVIIFAKSSNGKSCYDCNNNGQGIDYELCPRNSNANAVKAYKASCDGYCFIRTHANDSNVIYRGCADTQYNLPNPMPDDGCYQRKNETWCICDGDLCNEGPMGNSSGIPIDYHLTGPKKCYVCGDSYEGKFYPYCPEDMTMNENLTATNLCDGHCYTRSDSRHVNKTYRGCLDTVDNLPYPLPEDGCYPYRGETWCICLGSECNKKPLDIPKDVELDEHVKGINQCHSCRSHVNGVPNPICPLDDKVDITKTYKENCTAQCFTRTDGRNNKIVYRGCVDTQYGLPDPLPQDGCYKYYLEVWCICTGNLCNGAPLGTPQMIELDDHIRNIGNTTKTALALLFICQLILLCFS